MWIFKGEILEHDPFGSEKRAMEGTEGTRRGHAAWPPEAELKEKNDAATEAHQVP